jgi:hypothetical protein
MTPLKLIGIILEYPHLIMTDRRAYRPDLIYAIDDINHLSRQSSSDIGWSNGEYPLLSSLFQQVQFKRVALSDDSNQLLECGFTADTIKLFLRSIKWDRWLVLLPHQGTLEAPMKRTFQHGVTMEVFNLSMCPYTGFPRYTPLYAENSRGVLQWLRDCQKKHPNWFERGILVKPSGKEIADVATRLTLSPFWATAYRNRELPFAADSRKMVTSSYFPELERRHQAISQLSTDGVTLTEYQRVMVPLVEELKLLGFMETFDVRIGPKQYGRFIQRYLEILMNRYVI